MISKTEKNRIIRLKRQANYFRSRADTAELSAKQRNQAMANAAAISWAVSMAISDIEHRAKSRIKHPLIDAIVRKLNKRKYWLLKQRYDEIEAAVRDLYMLDVMDHERTFEGMAKIDETKAAEKAAANGDIE